MLAGETITSQKKGEMNDSRKFTLSVLVPVYNEELFVSASLRRLRILESSTLLSGIEVIVVDDGSSDGTAQALREFQPEFPFFLYRFQLRI